jgi:anti-anti-sigma factor
MKVVADRQFNEVDILDLTGSIEIYDGSSSLRDVIVGLLASGRRCIVLNLHDVTYVDGKGLGTIFHCQMKARHCGGELSLLAVTRQLDEQIRGSGYPRYAESFTIFTSEEEALHNFPPTPPLPPAA